METIFDKSAANWDDKPDRILMAGKYLNTLIKQFDLKKAKLLDFGSGTGLLTIPLSKVCSTVYAWDSSQEMRKVLRGKIEKEKIENVTVIQSDIEITEYKQRFDYILMSMVLHHVDDYVSHIAQMKNLLRSKGKLIIIDLDREDGGFHKDNTGVYHFGFSEEEIQESFKIAGYSDFNFQIIETVERSGVDNCMKKYDIFMVSGRNE